MLPNIHQLKDAPPFGPTAIDGLLAAEAMFQDALRYVPFCDGHRTTWSPHFARIILDAASQVDSVWKATTKVLDPTTATDKLTLKAHYEAFGVLVAKQEMVFFGGSSPCTIAPFRVWQASTFAPPPWWDAYNKLKHDRFSHQTEGTLDHAVSAVAALFLAILYSGACDVALQSAALLDPSDSNPWAFTTTGLLRDITAHCRAKLETKVFAHPLGVFVADLSSLSSYWMSGSSRFNIWWQLHLLDKVQPKNA
jgi:hypothetical protein